MRFQFKKPDESLPSEFTVVILIARLKIENKNNLPFEVFSGYYYNNKWHLTGQMYIDVFDELYEVTGWAHYQFTFNNKKQ